MTSLSAEEVLHWNDTTAKHWQSLLNDHPEALAIPCDIRESATVADLLQHIVAAELRYAQRLADEPITDYADIPKSDAAAIFATHDGAISKLRPLLADDSYDWEREVDFVTRSAGTLIATRTEGANQKVEQAGLTLSGQSATIPSQGEEKLEVKAKV